MSKFFNNFINVKIFKKSNDRILRKCLSRTQPVFTCSKLTTKTPNKVWICLKLTIKTPEWRQSRRSGVFIVNFKHISHLDCSSTSTVHLEHVNAGWEVWKNGGMDRQILFNKILPVTNEFPNTSKIYVNNEDLKNKSPLGYQMFLQVLAKTGKNYQGLH